MIPVKKEPEEVTKEFIGLREQCVFCKKETLYWHEKTNNPVCPTCAKKHKSELTNWMGKTKAVS